MAKLKRGIVGYFVHIVPEAQTYFVKREIPDVKLNKEMVELNYGYLSPFKGGDVIFYKDKHNLYLWFTKYRLPLKKINIPEGFLIYEKYAGSGDVLIIRQLDGDMYGITVIKEGSIAAQFSKSSLTEEFIEIIKKKHSLKDPEIKKFGRESTIEKVTFRDALRFLSVSDINPKTLMLATYETLKVPIIVFLVLVNVFDLATYRYVDSLINQKKIELRSLENSNKHVKEKFTTLEREKNFFENFMESELIYPNLYEVLSAITKSIAKNNATVTLYRQSYGTIEVWVVSGSVSSVVNGLISSGYFSNVQVANISQLYNDKTKEVGKLELTLKKVYRDGG